jgi:peptidoglycan LD-endopeptidase CwlK
VSSRKLTDLHPLMQPLVVDFLARVEMEGIDLLVTCTYRSDEEQAALYAISRTKPGRRVTNAPPGRSMHNFRFGGKPASLGGRCGAARERQAGVERCRPCVEAGG